MAFGQNTRPDAATDTMVINRLSVQSAEEGEVLVHCLEKDVIDGNMHGLQ